MKTKKNDVFRQQQYLQQQGVPAPGGPSGPSAIPHGIQKTPDRNIVGSPGVGGSPRKVRKDIKRRTQNFFKEILFYM